MDTNSQLAAYMDRALESERGVKVSLDNPVQAKQMQKCCINRRLADRKMQHKLHGLSNSRWDDLSFFVEGQDLLIRNQPFANAQIEDL